jgi:hypothetical protein
VSVSTFDRFTMRRGVSLLGVLVILLVVAFAAGLAIPGFFAQSAVTLDNAALLLVRDIHSAQNRALWAGSDTLVHFDDDGGGYRILDRSGRMVEQLGALGDFEQRFDDHGVFQGVRIARIDCGGDRELVFDGKRRDWEGGEIELVFRGDRRLVRIAPRTGEVRVIGIQRAGWDSAKEAQ